MKNIVFILSSIGIDNIAFLLSCNFWQPVIKSGMLHAKMQIQKFVQLEGY